MSRLIALALVAVVLCLAPVAQSQTTVYFSYSSVGYPGVCTQGALSCTLVSGSTNNYTCSSALSGNHTYYPSSTVPSILQSLSSSLPAKCEGYTADQQLPITGDGLNLQYGSSCINIYSYKGAIRISPDAVYYSAPATFSYSTSATAVQSCPQPIAATSSGSATVGFLYAVSNISTGSVCGAGSLSCTSYGSNEYVCSSLNSGTRYQYLSSTNTTSSSSLSSLTECNSWGDGYLPLDYEGLSFAFGNSQCVSIYTRNGTVYVNYEAISGTAVFQYGVGLAAVPASACAAYVPGITLTGAASRIASLSVLAVLATVVLAALSLLL